ncbi:MAG TPA: DUF1684 domain-containing protein [Nocardioides sp.]|uniref:DUF1684 domain-containing protein n=1 Tax=Nocardioides sp. TaxID=35761 RepID=UPI002F418E39
MKDLCTWSQHVASWRREVHALYADVRSNADPATAHAAWVERRTALFRTHPATARQPGQGLRHARYDAAYRFRLEMQPAEPEEWAPTTGSDGAVPFTRAGRFEIPGIGGLDVWWLGSYGNGIFVPLRDATAGRTTYGAGRYLLDTVKGADLGREGGAWVIDLNFSYNPSCAYDPSWACPLAPRGNRLEAEVPVGELTPSTEG